MLIPSLQDAVWPLHTVSGAPIGILTQLAKIVLRQTKVDCDSQYNGIGPAARGGDEYF